MNKEQKLQEEAYEFPYHYIPNALDDNFVQHVHWAWGFRYLGGINVVKNICLKHKCDSLLDIGCGDGRFLREMSSINKNIKMMGIDYSQRAISFASAFNPNIDYRVIDITKENLRNEKFDIVTLIEVIEHIKPSELDSFIKNALSLVKDDGTFIITVPHINKKLNKKHFQHFSQSKLMDLFVNYGYNIEFIPFDSKSIIIRFLYHLIGGNGKWFVLSYKPLLKLFYNIYIKYYLYTKNEKSCMRIACIVKKRKIS